MASSSIQIGVNEKVNKKKNQKNGLSQKRTARAPLLETISTLSSSLVYSDRSSNSSLSDQDETYDHHEEPLESWNDLAKLTIQSDQCLTHHHQQEKLQHEPTSQHRSRVRFNIEVQVNNKESLNSNPTGLKCSSSKFMSIHSTFKQHDCDVNQNNSNHQQMNTGAAFLINSSSSIDSNEGSWKSFRCNDEIRTVVSNGSHLTASSSSSTSTLNSTQSMDGAIDQHKLLVASYTNLPMIQARNHDQKQAQKSLIDNKEQQSTATSWTVQQQHCFKSILKDPLCAKLRNSLKRQKSKETKWNESQEQDNFSKQGCGNKISCSVIKQDKNMTTTINTIDTDQLESEIDQLLYGPVGTLKDALAEANNVDHSLSGISSSYMLMEMDPVLFANNNVDSFITNKLANKQNQNRITNKSLNCTSSSSANKNMPCQTYIQMIEEKYRHSINKSGVSSINNGNSVNINRILHPAVDVSNHSNNNLNYLNVIQSTNNNTMSQCKLRYKSGNKTKLGPQRQYHSSMNSHSINKSSNRTKLISNHGNRRVTTNRLNMMTTSLLMQDHSSIDQWMTTLAQESQLTRQQTQVNNIQLNQAEHLNFSIREETNNMELQQSDEQSANKYKTILSNSVRQEELYTMLSDPIKGPPINKLMDQLSKSWSAIENSIEGSEPNRDEHSSDGIILKFCSTPAVAAANGNGMVESNLVYHVGSNRSSTSSSCSTSTTARSRSLTAENHIYEEILYECLQQREHQQQYRAEMKNQ